MTKLTTIELAMLDNVTGGAGGKSVVPLDVPPERLDLDPHKMATEVRKVLKGLKGS